MRQSEVVKMLRKVEEVNALFVFGARVIPYLEELVLFVQETAPILEEMNSSIEESSRKMPFAVEKLDKVTETTETATAGMLDLIDKILTSLDRVMEGMTALEDGYKKRLDQEKELVLALARALDGEDVTEAAQVETELKNLIDLEMSETSFNSINDYLQLMQGDVFEIMNALQVQDITSQQIMGANSLIEAVQEKLSQLLTKFADIDDDDMPKKKFRAFDPNASFEDKADVQAMADQILAGNIDAIEVESTEKSNKHEEPAEDGENDGQEKVDQAEIDKLLQNMRS
ncbi:MAG: protein phosphatase CheZ [Deferribacteres bacterium]|nr:protein phosphatase CheZ [candidate division KSB1 bacterium]MCB9501914.1 protein phosphatase CheZ [Deferribacteres bacterium]